MHSRPRLPPSFWPAHGPWIMLLIAAAVVYCFPLFQRLDAMGWQDWDQFTFRYETPRLALLRDHQWPVWNPYAEGGTVLLAHPHSPVLSPWYLLTLLFGAPVGLRVQVLVFMILGAVGMAACVIHRLGGSRAAGVMAGITFTMSAHYALHITEGHLEWTALGLMPWIPLLIWPGAPVTGRAIIGAAVTLFSVVTLGAVYISALFLLFFTAWMALESVRLRQIRPLGAWIAVVMLAAGLSAAKLVPSLEFVTTHAREADGAQRTSAAALAAGLTRPDQAALYTQYRGSKRLDAEFDPGGPIAAEDLDHEYQEYGWYLGIVGGALACVGLFGTRFRHWPLFAAGALSGWLALGATAPIDLWSWVAALPLYGQFQVPSRMLAPVVFSAAIAAGVGLDRLSGLIGSRAGRWLSPVQWILCVLLYVELVIMGHALFGQIFSIPPVVLPAQRSFAQRTQPVELSSRVPTSMKSALMPSLRANSGTLHGYENLSVPRGSVRSTDQAGYQGEAYLTGNTGTVKIVEWTMGRIRLSGQSNGQTTVIINQNYAPGWHTDTSTEVTRTVEGLIGVAVEAGPFDIEVSYWPPGLTMGLWLSTLTAVLCLVGFRRW